MTLGRSSPAVTVAVGLIMLVVGALAGYWGRPLITPSPSSATAIAAADSAAQSAANDAGPSVRQSDPPTLMPALAAQTRHFRGDPNAPVTVIEFGDFK